MLNTVDPNDPIISGAILNVTRDKEERLMGKLEISTKCLTSKDFEELLNDSPSFSRQGISLLFLNDGGNTSSNYRINFSIFTRALTPDQKAELINAGLFNRRAEWCDWVTTVEGSTGLKLELYFLPKSAYTEPFDGVIAEIRAATLPL